MHVLYLGNFEPPHSTENHVARALENKGHRVTRLLERADLWPMMLAAVHDDVDFFLWTSTNDYAPPDTFGYQRALLQLCHDKDIPTVGYHLDLWFGLQRAHLVDEKPFFEVDLLCTADGGHDEEWRQRGISHAWFPPAISRDEARLGIFQYRYASPIAFVGSWRGGYHPESVHRRELVAWLKEHYPTTCRFWPQGPHAVRGSDLQDLFTSVKVVVGDSCLVPHLSRYWSDRIPETTGRGAFLLHPWVDGLNEQHPFLKGWPAGNWSRLAEEIQRALEYDRERERIAQRCREDTLENHTYERRMEQLIDEMKMRGLL